MRYVLLSRTAPLGWDGVHQEVRVLRSPYSGLRVVFRTTNWTIYELPRATPLLTGPADPVVTSFGHTVIGAGGACSRRGATSCAPHYSPTYGSREPAALRPAPSGWTTLELTRPERFALAVPGTPEALVGEIVHGKRATCKPAR